MMLRLLKEDFGERSSKKRRTDMERYFQDWPDWEPARLDAGFGNRYASRR